MALGPPMPTTAYVVVYNPSQYMNTIMNGQNTERIEALKHLLECIIHSDTDLITLGSIWLCVTGLLTNEEQQNLINTEIRICALKCVLELIKIEQLQRRFFNIWLSFDFLARYKIDQETDAGLWLECFYALTDSGKRMNIVDDRLRVRLLIQFINGILTGLMNRNNQAYQTLKDLLTNHCHLRYDELTLIMEYIFRYLNRDDDDNTTNINHNLHQQSIKKSFEFLHWLIDYHTLNTTLIHYFIQNIVDLHDKYTFSPGINTELLQLIKNHLAKTPAYHTSVISVLCGIIVERLETPINKDIDPLSTLLFVLTQTLIDIRQYRLKNQHQVQLSKDDIMHRRCHLNTIQQLPLCWITILHQVLIKRQNINIILINFKQFLTTIKIENNKCALNLFDMTVWKMMDEIMKICYQYLIIEQKSTTTTRTIYEDCLNIFEELANNLCCLPDSMVTHLFDIKRLTSITKTSLREQMIKQSSNELLRLIRPNYSGWSLALRELIEYIVLNANEPVPIRIEILTTIFEKYLWFKMTDKITNIGQIILDALENLIHIDLNGLTEDEFLCKHALMKQNAVKSIFEYFLSDYSIDSNLAHHCYQILQTTYEQDCTHILSMESIHRPLIELIFEKMIFIFEENLTSNRLRSFNHCSWILNFFIKQFSLNNSKIFHCLQTRKRSLIWQLLLNIRIRSSDSYIGIYTTKADTINYGIYRNDSDHKLLMENEYILDLHNYLSNIVDWLKLETSEMINMILGYLYNYLKEESLVYLSNININQLVLLLIDIFHKDLLSNENSRPSIALNCLINCIYYKKQIKDINTILDCFIEAINSSFIIQSIQAFIICLSNISEDIYVYIPKIIIHLSKILKYDMSISQIILEFLMHLLFGNFNDNSLIIYFLKILIDIINQYQCQTAHNLLLAHTLLCFYFNQLTSNQRQIYSYFIIRSLQQTSISRDYDLISIERPITRLQRSGSLSSLNDDMHNSNNNNNNNNNNNELAKRKMTVLDVGTSSSSMTNEDNNSSLKKLNDDLIRITINYLNEYFYEYIYPNTVLILLPREVRRHHINHSWLGDEQILYQIKSSYEFNHLNKAKDILAQITHDFNDNDLINNRFRRYTDGNKQNIRINKDIQILTTCQDDLHIRSLELDTNRSIFNERNLWITVIVRTFTSTKKFLAINLSASIGINHIKNDKFHWFEAVKLNDKNKLTLIKNCPDYYQNEHNDYSINKLALKNEFYSMINNIDRKDEENLLNRHNENYFPQTIDRVPSEARKSIESIDNVEPIRIAKIGVVYINPKQEITEINILSNIQTSKRYKEFMLSLAKLKSIKNLQQENFYCPLLDSNNPDNCGQYAYIWQNSIYQVLFHTSTLLPNTRSDHEFKKKLIGNDYVIIIYNENDYSFDMKTLKTGVCQYVIEVCPQINSNYTRVRLKRRINTNTKTSNSSSISSNDIDYLISDDNVGSYVRILALCLCQQGELETRQHTSSSTHLSCLISPWQNRLQALRSLHTRCLLSYNNRQ